MDWKDPEALRLYYKERRVARANGDVRRAGKKPIPLTEEEIQKKKEARRAYEAEYKRRKREKMTAEELKNFRLKSMENTRRHRAKKKQNEKNS